MFFITVVWSLGLEKRVISVQFVRNVPIEERILYSLCVVVMGRKLAMRITKKKLKEKLVRCIFLNVSNRIEKTHVYYLWRIFIHFCYCCNCWIYCAIISLFRNVFVWIPGCVFSDPWLSREILFHPIWAKDVEQGGACFHSLYP